MNAKQTSKLNMYRSTQQLCNDNATITASHAAFTQAFKAFTTKITNITGAATVESQITSGIAIDKTVAKKTLCQNGADVAGIIFAFASNTKNNTLKQAVNYSISDLLRIKSDLLVATCKNIYDAANNNLAALAAYGITAATLKPFQTAMDNYSASAPKTHTAKSVKSTYTDNIKTLIREADDMYRPKKSLQFFCIIL